MIDINRAISTLLAYGQQQGLFEAEDTCYVANRLLAKLGLAAYTPIPVEDVPESPAPVLDELLDWAAESYDTISMEKFSVSTPLRFLAASERYRKNHTAMQLEEYKNQFRIIPAVYGWATHLWPNFKIWGGKYKRAWKQRFQNRREG